MPSLVEICEQAARLGAAELQSWRGRFSAEEKGPADLVTEADLASQQVIRRLIAEEFPEHAFVGEEDTSADHPPRADAEYRWIVDPLDGTTNYVHGLSPYGVSVAVARGKVVLAGAVFDPVSQECFTGERGRGARLNGRPIATSRVSQLNEALMAASFPARIGRDAPQVAEFVEVLMVAQAVRRLGSAALNMCYVAAGRLDGYWATSVNSWDVAAGAVILEEAGGVLTAADGGPFDLDRPKLAAAATLALHRELLTALRRAGNEVSDR